ncbi:HD domain-containing protein [Cellulomonas fengjieae]|uniref:HD domain-containing protein n=1 Tax=Cellulomonas fengjieae TaxID=2819978 RepID=UPI001AAFA78B|nr:HD domain-containing protein [Cellulomonas fengjieae]MBO3100467.1 HD domain-containing protein [Cellulomonas fengjieae]
MTELPRPRTAVAQAAVEVGRAYYPPALFNHCLRSYHFAADAGRRLGLDVDDELLFVAALLHDIGLVAVFDSATEPFEISGGHLAEVFTWGAGWPEARRRRAGEVIVRHMEDDVDPAVDPEGHLLEIATGLDVSGRNSQQWPRTTLVEVLHRYPRLDLTDVFAGCFDEQARRKPDSLAAGFVRSGIRARLETNPLNDVQPFGDEPS